uniref:Uncharacterized protein n=1 Tax=Cucumis melo TaxID=3656 RepID=A0A9I9EJQ7_CUCME
MCSNPRRAPIFSFHFLRDPKSDPTTRSTNRFATYAPATCRSLVCARLSPVVSSNLSRCISFFIFYFILFNWANPRPDPNPFVTQFIIFPKINGKMTVFKLIPLFSPIFPSIKSLVFFGREIR